MINTLLAFGGKSEEELRAEATPDDDKYIGWYCKGSDVQQCGKMFGDKLEFVCLKCPN